MKKCIKYPKIGQFRNVIKDINNAASYEGQDENGEPIYNNSKIKPTVTFKGTVKLHGTNAAVSFNSKDGFWVQSRNNVITQEKDNAGFANFAYQNKVSFSSLLDEVIDEHQINTEENTVSIYGEWAGKGIQKGVGISEIEKSFFIFGVKVSPLEGKDNLWSYWVDSTTLRRTESRIYNIDDFKAFSVDIDFNNPQLTQNKLIEITEQVEKECPVSKELGVDGGVGEGVVWSATYQLQVFRFKVKGDKHSATKVKKLADVDVEKMNSVAQFVNYSVTENRFNQSIENVFGNSEVDIKKLGDVIRWMIADISSEESDTMQENGLTPKDVNKSISDAVRKMFFAAYN